MFRDPVEVLEGSPESVPLRRAVAGGDVGKVVELARHAAGLRQAELGELIGGYGQSTISRLESGRAKQPAPAMLRRAAEVLDIPPEWLGIASRPAGGSSAPIATSGTSGYLHGTHRLDARTVDHLELCIADYWRRDDEIGGRALQPAVAGQLGLAIDLLRNSSAPAAIRGRLTAAAAELARLSGWMLFDSQHLASAGRYYQQAVELAREMDDQPYVANVLASMSLRATYDEDLPAAVQLAQAAEDIARPGGTPRVMSILAMRSAFAHAAVGDTASCHAALNRADRLLDRAGDGDADPQWCRYFGEAKLLADTGIARARLGEHAVALQPIETALSGQEDRNGRPKAFHALWLARAQLGVGDLDQACAAATRAVGYACRVGSPRIEGHLREFRSAVRARAHEQPVREFVAALSEAVN